MRLIDADKMLKRIESWNTSDVTDKALYNFTLNRIVEQPTVNAVPVIRCKDCRYSDTYPASGEIHEMPLKCLGIRYGGVMPDWYCEHAERKEE